ncbi:MAG TPA: hypothetical protein VEI46_04930 [Thermodesulfovibrionales bacterium]|nr:hypothetical protein [Thermodesulfovibrionales bacterium]
MKRTFVFIFTGVLCVVFAQISFSEMRAENMPPSHGMEMKNITPENFNEAKSNILQKIEERLTRLNEEKACVQAASNADELKKCRPQRPGGPGRKGMQKPSQ